MICLSVILLEAGFKLDLSTSAKGTLTVILLMTFIPFLCEAFTVAYLSNVMMAIPYAIALTLGFQMGTVSPAILVPAMVEL